MSKFDVEWIDRGHPPRNPPDARFPHGVDIDIGERPACFVILPYMSKRNVGLWSIACTECGANIIITMASRVDDPKSLMLPCKKAAGHSYF